MRGITGDLDRMADVLARGDAIKICGLREPQHAAEAATAGADLIGFIFAPARRQVTAEAARRCIEAARLAAGARAIVAVGVFVDASASQINAIAGAAGLDAVQLHGGETPEFLAELDVPAIKSLRPPAGTPPDDVIAEIARFRAAERPPLGFLVDGFVEGALGGTGARADWDLARSINATAPLVLAGGLSPQNVAAAIREVRPLGVDVSSGVERDGVKSPALIEAFIREARAAFADR